MALASRPKPNVSHKKRQARHHRHSKHYLNTYWPYLPMLVIVGCGAVINRLWPGDRLPGADVGSVLAGPPVSTEPLTRVQVLAGSRSPMLLGAVITVAAAAFAFFVFRHGRRLQRYLSQGEAIVYRHAWLDIASVFVFTAGFILTRSAGLIH